MANQFKFKNQKGIALVIVLLVLALLTAMVVEFSYRVYTGTNDLYNWRDSQRLSLLAKSGINLAVRYIKNLNDKFTDTVDMSFKEPSENFNGEIIIKIEDETGKINLNSLVYPDGRTINVTAYKSFQKLLELLSLDKTIADRVVDWIDIDTTPCVTGSENMTKNSILSSVDELLLINGINRSDYDKLSPYVTVYGTRDNLIININTAGEFVLMSLFDQGKGIFPVTKDKANILIQRRKAKSFETYHDFNLEAGTSFSANQITDKASIFSIHAIASNGNIKRIIDIVLNKDKGRIEYWREY
ncbi:MAG: type II secretion system minor pseudopilin GspK [Nitrospirae bacterium]|jgi:general secretion pathway protein K|nr:type II secretion system minor pseudopilin GspK [Nitrospirota bacterium]